MKHLLVAASLIVGGSAGTPAVDHLTHLVRPTSHQVAVAAYRQLTPAQRVGQLFMAGVPSSGTTKAQRAMLRTHGIGNVILNLNTTRSAAALHRVDRRLAARLTYAKVAPFLSTDQEGGYVQRLRGPGFASIPTALAQGAMRRGTLRADSAAWGRQLMRARVNLNLAPDADVVPARHADRNQPIGRYDREFGHTPAVVGPHVAAVTRGMHDAGVAVAIKHFPGLGRASGNTDLAANVTDPTTRHDHYLAAFRAGVQARAEFVMMSSAAYPHIDGHRPACFSSTIMRSMLRRDLGFGGVVISDDLGTSALAHVPLGARATRFFAAGGTMLLDTTAGQLPAMIRAVRARQAADSGFAATIKHDVLTVLTAKAAAGLIPA